MSSLITNNRESTMDDRASTDSNARCPLQAIRERIRLMKATIAAGNKRRRHGRGEEEEDESDHHHQPPVTATTQRELSHALSCDDRAFRAFINRRFSSVSSTSSESTSSKRVSFATPVVVRVILVSRHEDEKADVFYTREELTTMASTERVRRNLLSLTLLVWRRQSTGFLPRHQVAAMYHHLLKKCKGREECSEEEADAPETKKRRKCGRGLKERSFYAREA